MMSMSFLANFFAPPTASTFAGQVDRLYFFLVAVSVFFVTLIFWLVVFFAAKYRRKSEDEKAALVHPDYRLEIAWTVIPFIISMVMFVWGANLFYVYARPPAQAMEFFVVGKQWMWKIQHPGGRREINQLHVPVGQAIKLTMTSEDVIHSFYIPAFRVKMDVVPGRYTQLWFQPTKPGTYHLFCAEYCGTSHSGMIGNVVVMEPARYEAWLTGDTLETNESLVSKGEKLYNQFNCNSCHSDERGPSLKGIYGRTVELVDGRRVTADENYLRESIMNPSAKVVKGYQPLMPTYAGQMNEEQAMQLMAYIKTLAAEQPAATKESAP